MSERKENKSARLNAKPNVRFCYVFLRCLKGDPRCVMWGENTRREPGLFRRRKIKTSLKEKFDVGYGSQVYIKRPFSIFKLRSNVLISER